MGGYAWVTLATNDAYSLGALVLAHSLRRVGTKYDIAILITPGVTQSMREKLTAVFNLVQEVNVLDSKDAANLALLKRPELGVTFTKLHCWRLTQFEKCVFLDADTLVVRNCDELFERDELSAAPDVGWPDCFNSGVFVYVPSEQTFSSILALATEKGSFDGGDQGLLNLYFKDWAHKDISKHLPFMYNMCSTAVYSYLPAFKQFGDDVRIIHFIGETKPWLQYFDTLTGIVQPPAGSYHLQPLLQMWWNIFCDYVYPRLSPDMVTSTLAPIWHDFIPSPLNIDTEKHDESFQRLTDFTEFRDPWHDYCPETDPFFQSVDESNNSEQEQQYYEPPVQIEKEPSKDESQISHYQGNLDQTQNNRENESWVFLTKDSEINVNVSERSSSRSEIDTEDTCFQEYLVESEEIKRDDPQVAFYLGELNYQDNEKNNDKEECNSVESNDDRQTSDSTQTFASCKDPTKLATHFSNATTQNEHSGLAGALATMTLGEPKSAEQNALEEHMRKQCWEYGNIDYLGRDSFENIWKKISETLSQTPETESFTTQVQPELKETNNEASESPTDTMEDDLIGLARKTLSQMAFQTTIPTASVMDYPEKKEEGEPILATQEKMQPESSSVSEISEYTVIPSTQSPEQRKESTSTDLVDSAVPIQVAESVLQPEPKESLSEEPKPIDEEVLSSIVTPVRESAAATSETVLLETSGILASAPTDMKNISTMESNVSNTSSNGFGDSPLPTSFVCQSMSENKAELSITETGQSKLTEFIPKEEGNLEKSSDVSDMRKLEVRIPSVPQETEDSNIVKVESTKPAVPVPATPTVIEPTPPTSPPTSSPISPPTQTPISSPASSFISSLTSPSLYSLTSSPIISMTSSPISPSVISPTTSPASVPTSFPVTSPTTTPIGVPISSPIISSITLPTSPPVISPVTSPTTTPISAPEICPTVPSISSPISSVTSPPTCPPISSTTSPPTSPPISPPIISPITTPISPPISSTTSPPTSPPISPPIISPTTTPISPPISSTTSSSSNPPISSTTSRPTSPPTSFTTGPPTSPPTNFATSPPTSPPASFTTSPPTSPSISSTTEPPVTSPVSSPIISPASPPVTSETSSSTGTVDEKTTQDEKKAEKKKLAKKSSVEEGGEGGAIKKTGKKVTKKLTKKSSSEDAAECSSTVASQATTKKTTKSSKKSTKSSQSLEAEDSGTAPTSEVPVPPKRKVKKTTAESKTDKS